MITARWPKFRASYTAELDTNPAFGELRALMRRHAVVTLLFAAKDQERNDAVVLREALAHKSG